MVHNNKESDMVHRYYIVLPTTQFNCIQSIYHHPIVHTFPSLNHIQFDTIKHDANGNTQVSDLTVVDVHSAKEVAFLLNQPANSR